MPEMLDALMTVGEKYRGFTVKRAEQVPAVFVTYYELAHDKSGAKIIHLHTADAENMFSVVFPTPPTDSAGVPHIMEHSVLAGSRKFPVRDPFFEMYKMSLATFINAMTGSDRTYYPVCSNSRADLFNLADVYFDAVFHPQLERDTFRREGHHLAPKDPERPTGELTVNGIVYNEMKSYLAQPLERLAGELDKAFAPDTCYAFNSGGDPAEIPNLTYGQFLEFHKKWYHPSNAIIVCYGDTEPQAFLDFLAPRLDEFERTDIKAEFPRQRPWAEPREVTVHYPEGDNAPDDGYGDDDEDEGEGSEGEGADSGDSSNSSARKTFLSIKWLCGDSLDMAHSFAMKLLDDILLGDPAAPLYRALIDSKVCTDLTSYGYAALGKDAEFAVGVRGCEPGAMPRFREVVMETLRKIADEGIDPKLVSTSFTKFSYSTLEIQAMRPLAVGLSVIDPVIHGVDPVKYLDMAAFIKQMHEKYDSDPQWLIGELREWLIDNPCRLDLTMAPDPGLEAKENAEFAAKMAKIRESITDDEARAIARDDAELQRKAGTPNSPEKLAMLPQLAVGDLPKDVSHISAVNRPLDCGAPFVRDDIFTNSVNYLAVAFDMKGVPNDLWDYVGLFADAFEKMGAAGRDFAETARITSASTGDLSMNPCELMRAVPPGEGVFTLAVGVKMLDSQAQDAMAILRDKLFELDCADLGRFRDIAAQTLAGLEEQLANSGSAAVKAVLQASLDEPSFLKSRISGRNLYILLKKILANFEDEGPKALAAFARIRDLLLNRNRVTVGFAGTDATERIVRESMERMLSQMSDIALSAADYGYAAPSEALRLAYYAPMNVSHCVKMMRAPAFHEDDFRAIELGVELLKVDYMVNEIRFKGNAYGAGCSIASGTFAMSSYADPHTRETFEVFDRIGDYIKGVNWGDAELARGKISLAKSFLAPPRPTMAAPRACFGHIREFTQEMRQERYDRMKLLSAMEVKDALLRMLENNGGYAPRGVITSKERLAGLGFDAAPLLP